MGLVEKKHMLLSLNLTGFQDMTSFEAWYEKIS